MVDSGKVHYSMDEAHYNDPYEHVNENQYSHQWVRVKLKEGYWIADAYGLYVGKELSPCQHPYK